MKKTIYLVEDSASLSEVLIMLIEDEQDLAVSGVSKTAFDALQMIPQVTSDLVLADLSLPGMNGIELIRRLLVVKPEQRTAILSGHAEPQYAEQALSAGAKGYILKGSPQAIIMGVRHVLSGQIYTSRLNGRIDF